ncbi:MAG TPA: antibiotic biosynthesis monooxygenase family protein [Gemmatimonadaceae bacterium]|nr:antibiotic biosynthesis monooxygenase family protein [Gemmatimonadaceae bacterium]
MPIYTTASFRVRPESLEKCEQAAGRFVERIRSEEPGTRVYLSLQDSAERTRFLHVMVFDDEKAEERHRHSAATREFTTFLFPELLGGVDVHDYKLVAGMDIAQEK